MLRKIAEVVRSKNVHHLPPTATVLDAARLMTAGNCGAVLVIEDGRLEGIFTERDLVRRIVAAGRDPAATSLAEVMTRRPDTIRGDALAIEGLRMMEDGGYRHLPVTRAGRVVGVISRRDYWGEEKAELEQEGRLWESIG
jgi:CBS domain-containing protein